MTKLVIKLIKYGFLIGLLIFIKNIYSNDGASGSSANKIVTDIRAPELIDINDPAIQSDPNYEYGGVDSDLPIFSEQIEFFNKQHHQQDNINNNINATESINKSLEQVLLDQQDRKIDNNINTLPESNQKPLEQVSLPTDQEILANYKKEQGEQQALLNQQDKTNNNINTAPDANKKPLGQVRLPTDQEILANYKKELVENK